MPMSCLYPVFLPDSNKTIFIKFVNLISFLKGPLTNSLDDARHNRTLVLEGLALREVVRRIRWGFLEDETTIMQTFLLRGGD